MYTISLIFVIKHLQGIAKQVWYADDAAAAGGRLSELKTWWNKLCSFSCHFGYNINAAKSWLNVKEKSVQSAQKLLAGTEIQITSVGCPYLGAAFGTESFVCMFTKQSGLLGCLIHLFATIQPHASYSTLTHGFVSK